MQQQQQQQGEHVRSAEITADDDSDHTERDVQQQQQQQHADLAEVISEQLSVQHNTVRFLTHALQQHQQQSIVPTSAADRCEHADDHLPQLQVQPVAVDTPIDSVAAAADANASFSHGVADAACSEDIELLRTNYKTLLGVVCREVKSCYCCYVSAH
jgi:hypothetical protein